MTFLRFFELPHTFSRTLVTGKHKSRKCLSDDVGL